MASVLIASSTTPLPVTKLATRTLIFPWTGTVMACEMGLRVMGIDRKELRADVPIVDGGIVTFLHQLDAGGTTLFI